LLEKQSFKTGRNIMHNNMRKEKIIKYRRRVIHKYQSIKYFSFKFSWSTAYDVTQTICGCGYHVALHDTILHYTDFALCYFILSSCSPAACGSTRGERLRQRAGHLSPPVYYSVFYCIYCVVSLQFYNASGRAYIFDVLSPFAIAVPVIRRPDIIIVG